MAFLAATAPSPARCEDRDRTDRIHPLVVSRVMPLPARHHLGPSSKTEVALQPRHSPANIRKQVRGVEALRLSNSVAEGSAGAVGFDVGGVRRALPRPCGTPRGTSITPERWSNWDPRMGSSASAEPHTHSHSAERATFMAAGPAECRSWSSPRCHFHQAIAFPFPRRGGCRSRTPQTFRRPLNGRMAGRPPARNI